jgi:hypothetical protein
MYVWKAKSAKWQRKRRSSSGNKKREAKQIHLGQWSEILIGNNKSKKHSKERKKDHEKRITLDMFAFF